MDRGGMKDQTDIEEKNFNYHKSDFALAFARACHPDI